MAYKRLIYITLIFVCVVSVLYRFFPGQAVADYIENKVALMVPGLELSIQGLAPCLPFGLQADTVHATWQNRFIVKADRFKGSFRLATLWKKPYRIDYACQMFKGRINGSIGLDSLKAGKVRIDSTFTGLDTADFFTALPRQHFTCSGKISGGAHMVFSNNFPGSLKPDSPESANLKPDSFKAEFTSEQCTVKCPGVIPFFSQGTFLGGRICLDMQDPENIKVLECKITGSQMDIEVSGSIGQAGSVEDSRLNLGVAVLAQNPDARTANAASGAPDSLNAVNFAVTGTINNPSVKMQSLPKSLFADTRPVKKTKKQEHSSGNRATSTPDRKMAEPAHVIHPVSEHHADLSEPSKIFDDQIGDQDENDIEPTTLDLELLGTVTGTGTDPAAVILKTYSGSQRLYATGDTIDDAVIQSIMRKQVILLVNGKKELLAMKDNIQTNDGSSEPLPRNFSKKFTLTQKEVTRLKDNVAGLSQQIRIKPHSQGGQLNGFWVSGIEKESVLYEKLGLRKGDLITGVNDQKIHSIEDAAQLYEKFNQANGDPRIDIQIKRHGKPGVLQYSIK